MSLPGGWRLPVRRLHGWRAGAVAALAAVTVLVLLLTLLGRLPGQGGSARRRRSATSSGSAPASSPSAATVPTAAPVLDPVGSTAPLPTAAGLTAALRALLAQPVLGPRRRARPCSTSPPGRCCTAATRPTASRPPRRPSCSPRPRRWTCSGRSPGSDDGRAAAAKAGQVVLVGAGDPTLASAPPAGFVPAPASLPQLATVHGRRAARRGHDDGVARLRHHAVHRPADRATWPRAYVADGVVGPGHRAVGGRGPGGRIAEGTAPRVPDPALAAAKVFARRARRAGDHGRPARRSRHGATRRPPSWPPSARRR